MTRIEDIDEVVMRIKDMDEVMTRMDDGRSWSHKWVKGLVEDLVGRWLVRLSTHNLPLVVRNQLPNVSVSIMCVRAGQDRIIFSKKNKSNKNHKHAATNKHLTKQSELIDHCLGQTTKPAHSFTIG